MREHCRNGNNIERLNVISDIASCLIHDNMNFIPSWNMKKEDEPTTHSRRYIGKLEYNNQDEFLVYAIYEGKNDKYIKSIYYDIRKEHEYKMVMIFTNDIEKIVLHEKGFFFGNNYTVLVPYNEYGKFLIRNNYEIRNSIYLRLKELYKVELTDFKFADLKLDDDNYIVIMPLINMEKLVRSHYYFKENVRSRMQLLNASIIFYAFDKLNYLNSDTQIHNSTNFMISCLYNAITEYYSDSNLQYKIDYGSG